MEDLQATPRMPTTDQIIEDLQSAAPTDIVFQNPPYDSKTDESVKNCVSLVKAHNFIKDKGECDLPQAMKDISEHIDELKTALKTFSSES